MGGFPQGRVGYLMHMRLHIEIEDHVVAEIDDLAGPRGRSQFIREAVGSALQHERERRLIRSARGSTSGRSHEWDDNPGVWVRNQRRADRRKVG
jgi:Arc/MetJ-type ribon-helix-helix transcriptional regulator